MNVVTDSYVQYVLGRIARETQTLAYSNRVQNAHNRFGDDAQYTHGILVSSSFNFHTRRVLGAWRDTMSRSCRGTSAVFGARENRKRTTPSYRHCITPVHDDPVRGLSVIPVDLSRFSAAAPYVRHAGPT